MTRYEMAEQSYLGQASPFPGSLAPLGADPTNNQHFYRFVQVMDPVMIGQTADGQWSSH